MKESFNGYVKTAFSDLAIKHRLVVVDEGPDFVSYASRAICMTVSCGGCYSYEIDFQVECLGYRQGRSVSFEDLVLYFDVPRSAFKYGWAITSISDVPKILSDKVEILDRYCARLFGEQVDFLPDVELCVFNRSVARHEETVLAQKKRLADKCWANKDYSGFIRIVEEVESDLDRVDTAKLAFARKKYKEPMLQVLLKWLKRRIEEKS